MLRAAEAKCLLRLVYFHFVLQKMQLIRVAHNPYEIANVLTLVSHVDTKVLRGGSQSLGRCREN